MSTRVLVIGGAGFVGRFLVEELVRAQCRVAVVGRTRHDWLDDFGVETIIADRNQLLRIDHNVQTFAPDVVVDLILSSGRQGRGLISVLGQRTGRIVIASSIDVYRASAVLHRLDLGDLEPVPLRETSRLRSIGPTYPPEQITFLQKVFGWLDNEYDKVAVEQAVFSESPVPVVVLRLPMMYGPRDPIRRLQQLVRRMDDGRRAIIVQEDVASWRAARGYVGDAAHALRLAALSSITENRVYNVAERESLSEVEWIRSVADVVGWQGNVLALPKECVPAHLQATGNFEQHWSAHSERIRQELGYAELSPRDAGLSLAIEWERAQPRIELAELAGAYKAEDGAIQRWLVDPERA